VLRILRQQILARRAERVDHQRLLQRIGGVRRVAGNADRSAGADLARHTSDSESASEP
jgi:hypothetical protein